MTKTLLSMTIGGIKDDLYVVAATAEFGLSQPYFIDVTFYADKPDLHKNPGLLGLLGTLNISYMRRTDRWSGCICEVELLLDKTLKGYYAYSVRLASALYFANLQKNCRSFSQITLRQLIKTVLQPEHIPFHLYHTKKYSPDIPLNYLIQYQETNLNFLSRVLESQGIGYYFTFDHYDYELNFFESNMGFKPIDTPLVWGDHVKPGAVHDYSFSYQAFKSGFRMRYLHPAINRVIECKAMVSGASLIQDLDMDPYYLDSDAFSTQEGMQRAVNCRLRAAQVDEVVLDFKATCIGIRPGQYITGPDGKEHYYIKQTRYRLVDYTPIEPILLTKLEPVIVELEATARPLLKPYAPAFVTPAPNQVGVLKAKVIAPKGKAIYTDKNKAGVKIQFVWDENTDQANLLQAPWVRVMQAAAGKTLGLQFMPRPGQEVICQFENGRMEMPIIIGAHRNKTHQHQQKRDLAHETGFTTQTLGSDKQGDGHRLHFSDSENSGGSVDIYSSGNLYENVKGDKTTVVHGEQRFIVEHGNMNVEVTDGEMLLQADDFISLQVGQSQIRLEPLAMTLQAKTIDVQTSGGGSDVATSSAVTEEKPEVIPAINTRTNSTASSWQDYLLQTTANSTDHPYDPPVQQPVSKDKVSTDEYVLQTLCVQPEWRFFVANKDHEDFSSLIRLDDDLQQEIVKGYIQQASADDNDHKWTSHCNTVNTTLAKHQMSIANQQALRPGWIYVFATCAGGPGNHAFKKTHLFKEYQVTTDSKSNHFYEVPLQTEAGKDARQPGAAQGYIELPYQFLHNDVPDGQFDVQVMYSEVQLSWPRLQKYGGLDPNDPRLAEIKNEAQCQVIQKCFSTSIDNEARIKRFGDILPAEQLKQIYEVQYKGATPHFITPLTGKDADTWCENSLFFRDKTNRYPSLLLDDPIGVITGLNTLYSRLHNHIIGIVNSIQDSVNMQTALMSYQFFFNLRSSGIDRVVDDGLFDSVADQVAEKKAIYAAIEKARDVLDVNKLKKALQYDKRQVIKTKMRHLQAVTIDQFKSKLSGLWCNDVETILVDSFAQDIMGYAFAHINFFSYLHNSCQDVDAIDADLDADILPADSIVVGHPDASGDIEQMQHEVGAVGLVKSVQIMLSQKQIKGYVQYSYQRRGYKIYKKTTYHDPAYNAACDGTEECIKTLARPIGFTYLEELLSKNHPLNQCLHDAADQQYATEVFLQAYYEAKGKYSQKAVREAQQYLNEQAFSLANPANETHHKYAEKLMDTQREIVSTAAEKQVSHIDHQVSHQETKAFKVMTYADSLLVTASNEIQDTDAKFSRKIKMMCMAHICDSYGVGRDELSIGRKGKNIMLSMHVYTEAEHQLNKKQITKKRMCKRYGDKAVFVSPYSSKQYFDTYEEAAEAMEQGAKQCRQKLEGKMTQHKAQLERNAIYIGKALENKILLNSGLTILAWYDIRGQVSEVSEADSVDTLLKFIQGMLNAITTTREVAEHLLDHIKLPGILNKIGADKFASLLKAEEAWRTIGHFGTALGVVTAFSSAVDSTLKWCRDRSRHNAWLTDSDFLGMTGDWCMFLGAADAGASAVKKGFFEAGAKAVSQGATEGIWGGELIGEASEVGGELIVSSEAVAVFIPYINILLFVGFVCQATSLVMKLLADNSYESWARRTPYAKDNTIHEKEQFTCAADAYESLASLVSTANATIEQTASEYRISLRFTNHKNQHVSIIPYLSMKQPFTYPYGTEMQLFSHSVINSDEIWPTRIIGTAASTVVNITNVQVAGSTINIDKQQLPIADFLAPLIYIRAFAKTKNWVAHYVEPTSYHFQQALHDIMNPSNCIYLSAAVRMTSVKNNRLYVLPDQMIEPDGYDKFNSLEKYFWKNNYHVDAHSNIALQINTQEYQNLLREINVNLGRNADKYHSYIDHLSNQLTFTQPVGAKDTDFSGVRDENY